MRWNHPSSTGGHEGLTKREREVLRLIAEGSTIKDIAARLNISPKTAQVHRDNLKQKLNLRSTAAIVRYAIARKMVRSITDRERATVCRIINRVPLDCCTRLHRGSLLIAHGDRALWITNHGPSNEPSTRRLRIFADARWAKPYLPDSRASRINPTPRYPL